MLHADHPVLVGDGTPSAPGKNLAGRKKRVYDYLRANGPVMANDLPTDVARNFVKYVTDLIEQEYDDAVSFLLFEGFAEAVDGRDGYTFIQAVAR